MPASLIRTVILTSMRMTASPPRGILVVDKPAGPSSHAIVAQARRALGLRKIGHAGTLDPAATGVLVLGVGGGTRLLGYLSGADKEYLSTFVFGIGTDTDDAQGDVVAAPGATVTAEQVRTAMLGWTGDILQRPSAVSAIKVDGRRAYDLVRSGTTVDLPARPVCVSAFDLLDLDHEVRDGIPVTVAHVRVVGTAGTYVRALARDVATDMSTVGHVSELRRTRSGGFTLEDAVPAETISAEGLMSLAQAARRSLPWCSIDPELTGPIRHGVQVPWPSGAPEQGPVALGEGDDLVAVAECSQGRARYLTVF